jgi:hypothetical protein
MSKSSTKASQSGQSNQTQNVTNNTTSNQTQSMLESLFGLTNQTQNVATNQTGATSQAGSNSNVGATSSTGASSQTATPNNLAALMQGWGAASGMLDATNGKAADNTNLGLDLMTRGAQAGSDAAIRGLNTAGDIAGGNVNDANKFLTPFADGSMSGANPHFNNMVASLARSLQPQVDGNFAAAGRYGSGANANAFADALTKQAGDLAYQNYGDSMNRQLNAGSQLSQNNATSTGQRLNALDLINGLTSTAAGAGGAALTAGQQPLRNFAEILGMFGSGGGTTTGTQQQDGTQAQAGNTANTGVSATTGNTTGTTTGTNMSTGLNFGTATGSQQSNLNATLQNMFSGKSNSTTSGFNLGDLAGFFSPIKLFG